jgi:hypothetical protein
VSPKQQVELLQGKGLDFARLARASTRTVDGFILKFFVAVCSQEKRLGGSELPLYNVGLEKKNFMGCSSSTFRRARFKCSDPPESYTPLIHTQLKSRGVLSRLILVSKGSLIMRACAAELQVFAKLETALAPKENMLNGLKPVIRDHLVKDLQCDWRISYSGIVE